MVVVLNSVVVPVDVPAMTQREPLIVFGGEVGERKGVDVLLRAWRGVEHRRSVACSIATGRSLRRSGLSLERLVP